MVLRNKLMFLPLGIALLLAAAALAYVATHRPRAEVAATIYDFGRVSEDQRLTHTFVIKNGGHGPLEIKEVQVDCTCTATDYERVISPGRQGAITLSIKPYWVQGPFEKKTRVFFNDPDHPEVVFTLKGISYSLIEVQPGRVIRLKGRPGEDIHCQVRLTSHLPEAWEIGSYSTDISQFIKVNLQAAEPGRSYVVEVRQKGQQPGKYQGLIKLSAKSPKLPSVLLRVFGEVLPQ